jgi:hypothetical protein
MQLWLTTHVNLDEVMMKNGCIYHLFLVAFQNKWKCSFSDLGCGSYTTRHQMASYSISIATINPNYKCTWN